MEERLLGLTIDSRDAQRLYLSAWRRRGTEATGGGGIYLSRDAGKTWRNVLDKDPHVYDVTTDPRNPQVLCACGFESSAWRSTDRGEHWRRIDGYDFKWGPSRDSRPRQREDDLYHHLRRQRLAWPRRVAPQAGSKL